MYVDPEPRDKPADAEVYISSSEPKVLALKAALWDAGCKVHIYMDKRVDSDNPNDTQDVWVLYHNAPSYQFREIRTSINF